MMASSPASSLASSPRLAHYLSHSPSAVTRQVSIHSTARASVESLSDQAPDLEDNTTSKASPRRRRLPSPITIPTPRRDPNRITEPLSGRGRRKQHFFPNLRDPSPLRIPGLSDDHDLRVPLSPVRHLSIGSMHPDRTSYYTPTSPLSPSMNQSARPISPQPTRPRNRHSPQNSRSMRLGGLPRFHPAVYQSPNQTDVTSNARPPTSPLLKSSNAQHLTVDSPKLMRQYQRELLARADISSRMAASPFTNKPDAPRIDPASSPGPVTPLALEGESDYFTIAGSGSGPAESPGARSEDSVGECGDKANNPKANTKKSSPRR